MGLSIVASLGGIGLAWLIYGARTISAEAIGASLRPMQTVLANKYWVDELYDGLVSVVLGLAWLLQAVRRLRGGRRGERRGLRHPPDGAGPATLQSGGPRTTAGRCTRGRC